MKKFLKGFKFAFKGILYCIKNERNMRIHTVAAVYILVFARFFELSKTDYAILIVTIAMVLAAETFNTSLERVANRFGMEYNRLIEAAKDTAAGAVLILALGAIGVALCLFTQPNGYINIYNHLISNPWALAILVISFIIALIYIIAGPVGISRFVRNIFVGKKTRREKKHE